MVEENQGTLSLSLSGQTLRAEVRRCGCLSQSCDTDRAATCTVTAEGTEIHVESVFAFTSSMESCTDDCGSMSASCVVSLTAEGDYGVTFDTRRLTLTLEDGKGVLFGGAENACPQ